MNNISIIRLLVLIPLLVQGAPDDPPPPSSTSRVQGAWPWVLGTVAGGAICRWAYNKWLPSQEKKAQFAAIAFKECLEAHVDGPKNKYEIPAQCTGAALDLFLMREYPYEPTTPKVQEMLDAIKQSNS